jgi:hypothetical protein
VRDFYLVQRLDRRDSDVRKGFDNLFACQYMGAAEFEYGALPESLNRIRSARKIVIHEGTVTRKCVTATVYVVGPKALVESIPRRLTEWMKDEWPFGHERSYFPEYVEGKPHKHSSADAWWALNEDVFWTLDPRHAEALLQAVAA